MSALLLPLFPALPCQDGPVQAAVRDEGGRGGEAQEEGSPCLAEGGGQEGGRREGGRQAGREGGMDGGWRGLPGLSAHLGVCLRSRYAPM